MAQNAFLEKMAAASMNLPRRKKTLPNSLGGGEFYFKPTSIVDKEYAVNLVGADSSANRYHIALFVTKALDESGKRLFMPGVDDESAVIKQIAGLAGSGDYFSELAVEMGKTLTVDQAKND